MCVGFGSFAQNHCMNTICICGAGTMGSGITQVAAISGYQAIQFDVNSDMLEKSKRSIEKNLQWLLDKGKISAKAKEECLNRIKFTDQLADCVADLVIEAIIEKKEAKINLFNQLALINNKSTILATNTSSISVTEIASGLQYPERVIGMHFFNPAPIMKLVELIKTEQTSPDLLNAVVQLANTMGKTPVICKDAPGFIVNRVARHYYLEAMKLVEEGSATFETIDAVMETSGFKMGPFKLMDLIGIDINYGVSNIVWEALGQPERLTPSIIQKQKLDAGDLGRKTGQGFYKYSES
jgi:3-hydroxybutyryl-CoA dehydrogenase